MRQRRIGLRSRVLGAAAAAVIMPAAAAASPVLMTSTSATAATTSADPRWTAGDVACNELSSSLCMNANVSTLGASVKGYGYTPGNNQDMDVTWQTSACNNGLVSETCPFKEGTGLNAELGGQADRRYQTRPAR